MVREYLSTRHRDNIELGCPSAALLEEIGRSTATTKQVYTEGVLALAEEIPAVWLPTTRSQRADRR